MPGPRVYDYVLGGKDNYPADREVADRLLTIVPPIADMAVENRQFLSRAASWAANLIGACLPACLLIGYLLHFYTTAAARDLVGKYAAAVAPG